MYHKILIKYIKTQAIKKFMMMILYEFNSSVKIFFLRKKEKQFPIVIIKFLDVI